MNASMRGRAGGTCVDGIRCKRPTHVLGIARGNVAPFSNGRQGDVQWQQACLGLMLAWVW